jgi:hypothetical protein
LPLNQARAGSGHRSRPTYLAPDTQASVSERGDRHSPLARRGQAAHRQHAGLLELDAQPSAARIRLSEGAARKVAAVDTASVRRAYIPETYAGIGPDSGTWRILIPGDGAAGDQGLRIGLPARRRLRDACGLSCLNDFLALWSQAHSSCLVQPASHIDLDPHGQTGPG